MAVHRAYIEWTDVSAGFLREGLYVDSVVGLSTLQAALQAKSNGVVSVWAEGPPNFPGGAATDALYPSVQDLAVLSYATGFTSRLQLLLPAPVASIFLADGITVDSSKITAITNAAIATLRTSGGVAVTAFSAGVRSSRRREQ